jgi:hypothetical protein
VGQEQTETRRSCRSGGGHKVVLTQRQHLGANQSRDCAPPDDRESQNHNATRLERREYGRKEVSEGDR